MFLRFRTSRAGDSERSRATDGGHSDDMMICKVIELHVGLAICTNMALRVIIRPLIGISFARAWFTRGRTRHSTFSDVYFATTHTTSSSATMWLSPTLCGLCLALAPQTNAYLNDSLSVR
jgi:hypothetical protein